MHRETWSKVNERTNKWKKKTQIANRPDYLIDFHSHWSICIDVIYISVDLQCDARANESWNLCGSTINKRNLEEKKNPPTSTRLLQDTRVHTPKTLFFFAKTWEFLSPHRFVIHWSKEWLFFFCLFCFEDEKWVNLSRSPI